MPIKNRFLNAGSVLIVLIALLVSGVLIRGAVQSAWLSNRGNIQLLTEWMTYDDLASLPRCFNWFGRSAARSWYEQALRFNQLNERAYFGLGRAAWLEGNCDEAVGHWNNALALNRQDIFAEWEYTNALFADGNTLQALDNYREFQAGPFFLLRGLHAASKGDYAEAIRSYELSVALQPTRDAVQELATEYITVSQQPEKAKSLWLALASTTQPGDPDHWWALGQAAEIDKRWIDALAYYDRCITLQTQPYLLHIAYSQAAVVSMQIPDYALSERYLRSALALQPTNLLDYLRLGELAQKQGHFDIARDWFQKAAKLEPESELPAYYLGVMLWETGDREGARQAFLKADKKNPHNSSVEYYLGLACYHEGKLDEAIAFLEQAIELYPGIPIDWMSILGEWYVQAGRCQDGAGLLQRISEFSPTHAQHLAETLHRACP